MPPDFTVSNSRIFNVRQFAAMPLDERKGDASKAQPEYFKELVDEINRVYFVHQAVCFG